MTERREPPRLVLAWEALPAWRQGTIALPALALLTFVLNVGPFNQPLARSVLYGALEGGVLTALLLVATAGEKSKRRR